MRTDGEFGETAPRVSIGIPVYNGEQFLARALDTLLAQDFTDFEIVIVDNASTDATVETVEKYQARDSRIRLFENDHNLGAAPNHNRSFLLSRGDLFKFGSCDDEYEPTWLSTCVAALDRRPDVVLAYTDTVDIDETGSVIQLWTDQPEPSQSRVDQRFDALVTRDHECFPIYGLVRSSVLKTTRLQGSYPDSDRVLLAEIALRGPMLKIAEPLFRRREHPGRSMRKYRTSRSRVEWFDTARSGTITLPVWRLGFEFSKAIAKAPISRRERLRCAKVMVRWLQANKIRMLRALLRAAYEYARAFGNGCVHRLGAHGKLSRA